MPAEKLRFSMEYQLIPVVVNELRFIMIDPMIDRADGLLNGFKLSGKVAQIQIIKRQVVGIAFLLGVLIGDLPQVSIEGRVVGRTQHGLHEMVQPVHDRSCHLRYTAQRSDAMLQLRVPPESNAKEHENSSGEESAA